MKYVVICENVDCGNCGKCRQCKHASSQKELAEANKDRVLLKGHVDERDSQLQVFFREGQEKAKELAEAKAENVKMSTWMIGCRVEFANMIQIFTKEGKGSFANTINELQKSILEINDIIEPTPTTETKDG